MSTEPKDTFNRLKDYCTKFPDKIGGDYYGYCCFIHDFHYSNRPCSIPMSRFKADNRLAKCVFREKALWLAILMWFGVRIFGRSYYERES